jgi:hypothetical protein
MAGASLVVWIILSVKPESLVDYKEGFSSRILNYFPVGIAWLLVMFYDTDLTRDVFTDIATLSMWGPWENHWDANASFFIDSMADKERDDLWFLVWTAVFVTATLAEQVI